MARILICHVPKDGGPAREIGAALMGRGHFVSFDGEPDTPRADRTQRLRQFETVIVMWTEHSYQSQGLSDIAREALPLNLLVPIRAEAVPVQALALSFRKLNMLSPRDIDGISRSVARISTAASSLKDMVARDALQRGNDQRASREAEHHARDAEKEAPRSAPQRPQTAAPASANVARQAPPLKPLSRELPDASTVVQASRPGAPGVAKPVPALTPSEALRAELNAPPPPPPPKQPPTPNPLSRTIGDLERALQAQHEAMIRRERPDAETVTADELAALIDAGLLEILVPEHLWLGEAATIEVRLGKARRELEADAAITKKLAPSMIETLSLSLYGLDDVFEIERQSERTQFLGDRYTNTELKDPDSIGRWAWLVTPRQSGDHELVLRISSLLRDRRGVPTPLALPDRRLAAKIDVPDSNSLMSSLSGWLRR